MPVRFFLRFSVLGEGNSRIADGLQFFFHISLVLRNVRICVFLVAECLQGLSNRCEGNPGWVFWTAFLINSRVPAGFFTIGGFSVFCMRLWT